MKKIVLLFLLPAIFGSFTKTNKSGITNEEKKFAANHLKETQDALINAVQGLAGLVPPLMPPLIPL